jgi:hypothetical protein
VMYCFSYQFNMAFLMYFNWPDYLLLIFTLTTGPYTDSVIILYINYFLDNSGLSTDDCHWNPKHVGQIILYLFNC